MQPIWSSRAAEGAHKTLSPKGGHPRGGYVRARLVPAYQNRARKAGEEYSQIRGLESRREIGQNQLILELRSRGSRRRLPPHDQRRAAAGNPSHSHTVPTPRRRPELGRHQLPAFLAYGVASPRGTPQWLPVDDPSGTSVVFRVVSTSRVQRTLRAWMARKYGFLRATRSCMPQLRDSWRNAATSWTAPRVAARRRQNSFASSASPHSRHRNRMYASCGCLASLPSLAAPRIFSRQSCCSSARPRSPTSFASRSPSFRVPCSATP